MEKRPLVSGSVKAGLVSGLLIVAYFAIPFAFLPRYCPPESAGKPVSYRLVVDGETNQTGPTTHKNGPIKAASQILSAAIKASGSAEPIHEATEPPRAWRLKFACEFNIGDFAVGLFTLLLGIATFFLWRETERLARGAEGQATDIQEQLRIARDDFAASHRPWISFSVQPLDPGITVDADGIFLSVRFKMINHGSSPAIGASANAMLYFYDPDISEATKQRDICAQLTLPINATDAWGTCVMPETPEFLDMRFGIPRAEYDAVVAAGHALSLVLSGCIDYGFPFGDGSNHQSGFVFYIGKKNPNGRGVVPIDPGDTAVPPGQIFIGKTRTNGTFFVT